MVAKQNFTTQKMDHTAIFITWGDLKKKIYFRIILIFVQQKSFDEEPVRAKM